MIKYKCETCNFEFEVSFDDDVAICPICGNEQKGFYDFNQTNNPKVFWEKVINKYKAEYENGVIKINTYRRKCIYEDEDYIKTIELSSGDLREKYLKEAKEISYQEKELYKNDIKRIINEYFEEVAEDKDKVSEIYRNKIHFEWNTEIILELEDNVEFNNRKANKKEVLGITSLEYIVGNVYRSGYAFNKWEISNVELNDHFQDIKIYIKDIWNKIYEIEYDLDGGEYKNETQIWDSEYTRFSDLNDVYLPNYNIFRGKEIFVGWYDEKGNLVDEISEYRDYKLKAKYAQYVLHEENEEYKVIEFEDSEDADEEYEDTEEYEDNEYLGTIEFGVIENVSYNQRTKSFFEQGFKENKIVYDKKRESSSIVWDIIEKNGNEYTLVTKDIKLNYFRDNFSFFDSQKKRFLNFKFINPNNYEFSKIRALLNSYDGTSYGVYNYTEGGFLNSVFSEEGKKLIKSIPLEVLLENYKPSNKKGMPTEDKVYLLSESEFKKINSKYNRTIFRDSLESKYVKAYENCEYVQELVDNTKHYKDGYIMIKVVLD